MHYFGGGPTQYETAIRAVGEIIQDYDSDKLFPVLGFGARLPATSSRDKWESAVSHEFFVNMHPTSPYCAGIEGNNKLIDIEFMPTRLLLLLIFSGIVQAYRNCLQIVDLYGPTNFAPVIDHVVKYASAYSNGDNYFILLILTDGVICDMEQTKRV